MAAVVLLLAVLAQGVASLRSSKPEPGAIIQPEIVVPGEWLTDEAEKFLFLPLTIPEDLALGQAKVMSNGESLLVVVTEQPQDQPDTMALKRYKLLVEALKVEVGHDNDALIVKLQDWYDTEDDDEVRVHIMAALDSLKKIVAAKENVTPRTVSVPLGAALAQQAVKLLGGPNASLSTDAAAADRVLPSLRRSTKQTRGQVGHGIIKESFAVEIPYPVPTERIFVLKAEPTLLLVGMPLVKNSLEANGISTGERPFNRVPVFSVEGQKLAGPTATLEKMVAESLHLPSLASRAGLKPLQGM